MKRVILPLIVAASLSLASCASFMNPKGDAPRHGESVKQCGDTPRDVVRDFFQGMKEMSLSILRGTIFQDRSLYRVFGKDDERRGEAVVRELIAHPEIVGAGGSCACSLLSIERTDDPAKRIVWVKRITTTADGEDIHLHRRSLLVTFDLVGNCILDIERREHRWERYE